MNLCGKVMGSHGAIGTTYNVMPRMFVAMDTAFKQGDIRTAMDLQVRPTCTRLLLVFFAILRFSLSLFAHLNSPSFPAPFSAVSVEQVKVNKVIALILAAKKTVGATKALLQRAGFAVGPPRVTDPLTPDELRALYEGVDALDYAME